MGFSNYFVQVGSYQIPSKYILLDSYKGTKGSQDIDSYRDANGILHRNTLDHFVYKVEFQLRPMTNTEFATIMSGISSNFTSAKERKANVSMYIPEEDAYTTSLDCYIPDPEITIKKQLDASTLKLDAVTLKFIGY